MSEPSGATVPAGLAPVTGSAAAADELADVRTYHRSEHLTHLSDAFTKAMSEAAEQVTAGLSEQDRSDLSPDYFVASTRNALRHLLNERFGSEVAVAYAAALVGGDSQPASPVPSTPGAGAEPAPSPTGSPAPSSSPRKPIRTYIDGCFDIMHSGHYNAIRQAKALTDVLVVGVHSDAEILMHKGPPVMNEQERLATVKACKWVDEVVFDTPYNPSLELLIKLNCDFCVHGDDMTTTADGKDAYAEVKEAGRMRVIKRTEGVSTTDLVGRLLLMTKNHHLASPALTPITSKTASPSLGALSSQLSKDALPALALEPPAVASPAPKSPPRKDSAPPRKDSAASSSATAAALARTAARGDDKHYSSGISNFLPTTWRITQFSNHRTPGPDDKIVYIDGAFDLFHVGHIETLKKAKELGTFLYVGIHDDATVNQTKSFNYPIMNLHERVLNVLSCKYVDEVVIGAPWVVNEDLIKSLNLHVVASGSNTKMDAEWVESASKSGGHMHDPYVVPRQLGIFREIETTHSLNTDKVVKRIIENRLKYENRNAKRSVKELDYLKGSKQYVAEI